MSLVIVLFGVISLQVPRVREYPPSIPDHHVRTNYAGANAEVSNLNNGAARKGAQTGYPGYANLVGEQPGLAAAFTVEFNPRRRP